MYKRTILIIVCLVTVFLSSCVTNYTKEPTETYLYASDKVVDKFISSFKASSKFEITEIKQGNIRTKYFALVNDCYIEMINATDNVAGCFSITINGGQTEPDKDRMFEVFKEIVPIIDQNLSKEDLDNTIDYLQKSKYMISDYKINENILIETYLPIIETSNHYTSCRIDIAVYNYT